jgi:hypothetical protein
VNRRQALNDLNGLRYFLVRDIVVLRECFSVSKRRR